MSVNSLDIAIQHAAAKYSPKKHPLPWSQLEAIDLCRRLERMAPKFGAHIALTGGCLYKKGPRKDVDILIYRIRQQDSIDIGGFIDELSRMGVYVDPGAFGWVYKACTEDGRNIDFFFPEEQGDQYEEAEV